MSKELDETTKKIISIEKKLIKERQFLNDNTVPKEILINSKLMEYHTKNIFYLTSFIAITLSLIIIIIIFYTHTL